MSEAVLSASVPLQIHYSPEYLTVEVCVQFWRAVLEENINCFLGHGYQVTPAQKRDAHLWVNSDEFDEVCDMAGFDPVRARASVLELSRMGFCSLEEACDAA